MENGTNRLRSVVNLLSLLGAVFTVLLCVYWYRTGVLTSTQAMSTMLRHLGLLAPLLFILLQVVQVVVPIIPGAAGCVAGVIIFGPWQGFLYNYIGICIGSVINFLLARRYGQPLVRSMVKESVYNKYVGWLDRGNHFTTLFALAIFLPVAPDDFLCMLAGLTKMELTTFTAIIILAKPLSIFAYSTTMAYGAKWLLGVG
ncbi:MAG: VTT domain-containing protein [Angelakisella sp.]